MAYFLILSPDRAGALDERTAHRQEHIDYWSGKTGVVKVAGAMLAEGSPSGSAFVLEAADEVEAHALLAGDPFTTLGVFAGEAQVVAIRPAIGEWLAKA